jgi:outer membrane protein assembly factor BamB
MRILVLLIVAALGAIASAQRPRMLWEVTVRKANELEMEGNNVILRTSDGLALYDASTGKKLGTAANVYQSALSAGKLLVVRGDYYKPGVLEVYGMRPFIVEAKMPNNQRIGLGEIVGQSLYYTTENSVVRVKYPGFQPIDARSLGVGASRYRLRVSNGVVYVNFEGHETYGLNATDLSRGWRSYCDAWPQYADELGFVGTATVGWNLKIVNRSGKIHRLEHFGGGRYAISRSMPLVTRDFVVAAGNVSVSGYDPSQGYASSVLSEYLLAFNRSDGSLAWRVPMLARSSFYGAGLTPVLMNNNRIFVYGANKANGKHVWTLQVRDLRTGRLLWKSKPVPEKRTWAMSTNGKTAVELADSKLRGWRIAD